MADLTPFRKVGDDIASCKAARTIAKICPCVLQGKDEDMKGLQEMHKSFNLILKRVALEYQKAYLESLLKPGVKDSHTNAFVVFYQPAFEQLSVEKTGVSILSVVDCFHPNYCGHQALAYCAFGSMFASTESEKRSFALQIGTISNAALTNGGDSSGRMVQLKKASGVKALTTANNATLAWNCPKHDTYIR